LSIHALGSRSDPFCQELGPKQAFGVVPSFVKPFVFALSSDRMVREASLCGGMLGRLDQASSRCD
jgi:hypothetical protein